MLTVSQETKAVLEKLYKYIGKNIKNLIDRSDEPYCLRLHSNRVYYVRESLMRRATNVSIWISQAPLWQSISRCWQAETSNSWYLSQVGREQLVSLGQCIGKLTHSGKFRLTIGALDVLGSHAKYKVSHQSCLLTLHWSHRCTVLATQGWPLSGLKPRVGQTIFSSFHWELNQF